MSKYSFKGHRGTVIFSSVVAGAAIAPMVTGQMQQEEHEATIDKARLPLSTSVPFEVNTQMHVIPLIQPVNHINQEPQKTENNTVLTAGTLADRGTSQLKKESIQSAPPLRLVLKEESKSSQILSEAMVNIWPEDTILTLGDEGPKVKTIQKYLKEIGYYVHTIDGEFGEKTRKAIKLYQKEYGLTIDGIVGVETINHLVGMKQTIPAEPNVALYTDSEIYSPIELHPNVYMNFSLLNTVEEKEEERNYFQYGDNDEEIIVLQELLKKAGYYNSFMDGIYGSSTQQAVRLLQREQNLRVDGFAGKEVMSFLQSNDLKHIADKREKAQQSKVVATTTTTTTTTKKEKTPSTSSSMENVISRGQQLVGTPYVWGGTSTSGFDCSGFLVYIFNQHGMELPRTVSDIWNITSSVQSPERGDFVFFETYKKGPSHAGIYLGDGAFIHTGTSSGVTISYLNESYWSARYLGARKY